MASKRRLSRKQCRNKRRYKTTDEAKAAIDSMRTAGIYKWQKAYSCKFCKGHHIGRPSRKRKKENNKNHYY